MPDETAQTSTPNGGDHGTNGGYGPNGDSHQYGGQTHDRRPGGGSYRFFGWIRSLGIVRQNGWIGGVCGAIAARLGIDPIIVRGIAVVAAILGGPALLLYAAAWLLLPDAQNDIHLERLIRGHFDPAIVTIIVIALLAFTPFTQGLWWWTGGSLWDGLSWGSGTGRVLWTLVIIGLIVWFVVWAARSGRVPPAAPRHPEPPAAFTAPSTDAGGGAATASATAAPASTTVPDPGTPAPEASQPSATPGSTTQANGAVPATAAPAADGEYSDWRQRQDAWRADYAAWSTQQADARTVRQQRSAEIRAQAQALTAEADEARRRRRAANPRTSAAYVGIALGLALIAAGIASAVALGGDSADYALPIALAAATGIVGLSVAVAGLIRRRSGFLTFVSIVLIVCTLGAAVPPRGHTLALPNAYFSDDGRSVYQPVGSLYFDYSQPGVPYTVDVVQNAGSINISLENNVTAEIIVDQSAGSASGTLVDAETNDVTVIEPQRTRQGSETRSVFVVGDGAHDVVIHVHQNAGDVNVHSVTGG